MPPIPVHIDDPITPAKPEGVTPATSNEHATTAVGNVTTTTQSQLPAYPPAQPGAAAVPAPTPYIPKPQPAPTQTTQRQPNGPPPPQPGAVPVPVPRGQQAPMTATSTLPPPPKPGEALQQRQTTMPSQMNIPPPQQNYAPTHSTSNGPPPSTTSQQQNRGPTILNLGPVSSQAQPPAGYHQNVHAQEMSSVQRSSLEEQERRESVIAGMGGDAASETAGSMWTTVKGWASTAGEKLAETEENVWKRINGD